MAKNGKRFLEIKKKVDEKFFYNISDAIKLLKETSNAKFDETVEAHIRLGIDPRHAEQQVRSTVILPFGVGKIKKILVFAKGEKEKEALSFGADFVGLEELVNKIKNGWIDFDVVIATPDVMGIISKIGKILGPRGLMPNPKVGTVTNDISKAIKEIKLGKIEFKNDKNGIIHIVFGKASFENISLEKNFKVLINEIIKNKPNTIKDSYFKSITIKSTMGPGIKINIKEIIN